MSDEERERRDTGDAITYTHSFRYLGGIVENSPRPPKRASIEDRIVQFLMANTHRFWTDMELEQRLVAASVRRRRQEMFEEDRKLAPDQRRFEEREVKNKAGSGKHIEYRWVPEDRRGAPRPLL